MRNISKAISGAGLLISGSLFINLVMAGMDWKRIGEYGLFHELSLRGCAPIMFWIGVFLAVIGVVFVLTSAFQDKE